LEFSVRGIRKEGIPGIMPFQRIDLALIGAGMRGKERQAAKVVLDSGYCGKYDGDRFFGQFIDVSDLFSDYDIKH